MCSRNFHQIVTTNSSKCAKLRQRNMVYFYASFIAHNIYSYLLYTNDGSIIIKQRMNNKALCNKQVNAIRLFQIQSSTRLLTLDYINRVNEHECNRLQEVILPLMQLFRHIINWGLKHWTLLNHQAMNVWGTFQFIHLNQYCLLTVLSGKGMNRLRLHVKFNPLNHFVSNLYCYANMLKEKIWNWLC